MSDQIEILNKDDPANEGKQFGKCNRGACYGTALIRHTCMYRKHDKSPDAYYCYPCANDILSFSERINDSLRPFIREEVDAAREKVRSGEWPY